MRLGMNLFLWTISRTGEHSGVLETLQEAAGGV